MKFFVIFDEFVLVNSIKSALKKNEFQYEYKNCINGRVWKGQQLH